MELLIRVKPVLAALQTYSAHQVKAVSTETAAQNNAPAKSVAVIPVVAVVVIAARTKSVTADNVSKSPFAAMASSKPVKIAIAVRKMLDVPMAKLAIALINVLPLVATDELTLEKHVLHVLQMSSALMVKAVAMASVSQLAIAPLGNIATTAPVTHASLFIRVEAFPPMTTCVVTAR
jgi:hypothetical protein